MQRFSTVDLDQRLGDVKAAAARQPVVITEHRKDRYVLMSVEDFAKLTNQAHVQRVYGAGQTPEDIADMFLQEINRILKSRPVR